MAIDLTGQKFGRLTVIRKADGSKWHCVCDCGKEKDVRSDHLKEGRVKSCGCFNSEVVSARFKVHGLTKHPIHKSWTDMKQRCYNPSSTIYEYYGGRGIKICDEWEDFKTFYDWSISNGWSEGLSIDRIDVNGNYEPSNCRWVSMKVQCNNKRSNRLLTFDGKTLNISQWAEQTGIERATITARLDKLRWCVEKALTEPVRGGK